MVRYSIISSYLFVHVLAISSRPIKAVSGLVWACLGLSGFVWACLDLSGRVWTCLGLSGYAAVADFGAFSGQLSLGRAQGGRRHGHDGHQPTMHLRVCFHLGSEWVSSAQIISIGRPLPRYSRH